jgi:excisionase family DNA binding protein
MKPQPKPVATAIAEPDLPPTLSVEYVKSYLRLSPASVYRGLHRGDIPAERVGSRWLIKRQAFFEKFGRPDIGRLAENSRSVDSAQTTSEELGDSGLIKFRAIADRTAAGETPATPDGGWASPQAPIGGVMATQNPHPPGSPGNPWLEVNDVTDRLHCDAAHVRKLCRKRKIRFRPHGRRYTFLADWVNEYIDKTTVDPNDDSK